MKLKGLALFIISNLTFCSIASHASITVYTPSLSNKGDVCEKIAGHWEGKGKVTAAHFITCIYKGSGDFTTSGGPSNFNLHITLAKDPKGSSFLCPASEDLQMPGECKNGVITLKTEDADLSGDLKNDSKAIDMLGTVTFTVGTKPIKANVDYMHLDKQ